jgi:hypothetical protein
MKTHVRIAAGQGFYGDSPFAALAVAAEGAADYLVHDALAELTLSILQKDRQKDPALGFARDIELYARTLYPLAFARGIRVVSNSGGLNPKGAAERMKAALEQQKIKGIKIAAIDGDDVLDRLDGWTAEGHALANLDHQRPLHESKFTRTHANVYIGAQAVKDALDAGANLILAGRVADPCLTLGILAHEFGWNLDPATQTQADLDKLASGIGIGHLLECGGQASGGNSYAEWPMNYPVSNLSYPIATCAPDGSAVFSRLMSQGGKLSRDTLREQLVYEIHDPSHYITPDVIVDFTHTTLTYMGNEQVAYSGAKGKPRPDLLKLCIGLHEGYMTDQFFFFSWPYARQKAEKFVQACREIWSRLPIQLDRIHIDWVGLNGIHGAAAPEADYADELNELGIRIALQHREAKFGKMAMQAVIGLALNGPPGLISVPGWGNEARAQLSLWPTLIPREWVTEAVTLYETA